MKNDIVREFELNKELGYKDPLGVENRIFPAVAVVFARLIYGS